MLTREVPCHTRPNLTWLWSVLVVVTCVTSIGSLLGSRVIRCMGESKLDIARSTVKKYVYEAYPSWAAAHPDQVCPTLDALNEYMNNTDTRDPWGSSYTTFCGDSPGLHVHGFAVLSAGEDGEFGTPDDVKSWE